MVTPDILAEVRTLSQGLLLTALFLGLALWILGTWGHRFWVVLALTVSAGLYGLGYGTLFGLQPLVAGLLLAVAAGTLALAVLRVLVFVAGGVGLLLLVQQTSPAMDEPLMCVLLGGLAGLFLLRPLITMLTGLAGTLLLVHAGLGLADQWKMVDSVAWAEQHALLLNWSVAGATLVGILAQYLFGRWWKRRLKARSVEQVEPDPRSPQYYPPRSRWLRGDGNADRMAG